MFTNGSIAIKDSVRRWWHSELLAPNGCCSYSQMSFMTSEGVGCGSEKEIYVSIRSRFPQLLHDLTGTLGPRRGSRF